MGSAARGPGHLGETRAPLDAVALWLCVVGAAMAFGLFLELRHDDAYVTFRYARNLATGQGMVFNPGDRILGTTSPLFALLMAAPYALFGDVLPAAAVAVNALALGLQALLLYRVLREAAPWTALGVCLLVLCGLASSHSWLTLETNLALTLSLASLWLCARGQQGWAGLLLGLAFLTRHDSALMGLILVGYSLWRSGRLPLRAIVLSLCLALPWLAFAAYYFGDPMPHTLSAKIGATTSSGYLLAYLRHFSQLPGLSAVPGPLRMALSLLCFASGMRFSLRCAPVLFSFGLFGLLLLLVYAGLAPPSGQHWHMYPATLALRCLMVVGVLGPLESLAKPRALLRALQVGLTAALVIVSGYQTFRLSREMGDRVWFGERHRRYTLVAAHVLEHMAPSQRFMSTEVGTLGYLTDHHMIDPFGLVNWTNDWPRTMLPRSYLALVVHYRPDIILLDSPRAAEALAAYAPELHYEVVRVFDWGYPFSTLAVRRDPPN